jgi:F420-dependent oxidoreductase-like protein
MVIPVGVTRFGLQMPNFSFEGVGDGQLFEHVIQISLAAEEAGFDSLWLMDHFYQIANVGAKTEPMLEPYVLLGAIAGRTNRIQLGTLVTSVTYRNPAHLAKAVTTLDVISSGRAILGIGAGWNEEEHSAYGFEFPSLRTRMERLTEAVMVCRAMFNELSPTFEGAHYSIHDAMNFPRPVRPNGIPILIGGNGEQKTLRLVAQFADACNVFGDAATIQQKLDVLQRHCEDLGRDPKQITKTAKVALIVAETESELTKKIRELGEIQRLDPSRHREHLIAGTSESVVGQIEAFLSLGLDGIIFSMRDIGSPELVRRAGNALRAVPGNRK